MKTQLEVYIVIGRTEESGSSYPTSKFWHVQAFTKIEDAAAFSDQLNKWLYKENLHISNKDILPFDEEDDSNYISCPLDPELLVYSGGAYYFVAGPVSVNTRFVLQVDIVKQDHANEIELTFIQNKRFS